MIDKKRFGLNRIIAPSMSLEEFFDFADSVGIRKLELRNDLDQRNAVDDMKPADAAAMAKDKDIEIISINALQKFNLAPARPKALKELEDLLSLAKAIKCKAVVLCPNNDPNDKRPAKQRAEETVDSLKTFGPLFTGAKILGLVEPLGFEISSLASLVLAQECIKKSGFNCYKIVHDTFHHHIGPDDRAIFSKAYDVANTGLMHISGVEDDIPIKDFRDGHRIMVGPNDRMKSKEQILLLDKLGYKGDYSFEPFSPEIQKLSKQKLADEVKKSIDYILS
jgi:2-keto-myo-inositol isomerase